MSPAFNTGGSQPDSNMLRRMQIMGMGTSGHFSNCTGPEDVPLAVGTIRGLRSFTYRPDGTLHSPVVTGFRWTPGENISSCTFRRQYDETGQHLGYGWELGRCSYPFLCGCGFWAYHDGYQYTSAGDVYGVIDGYGVTTVGTRGFRCEKAKILALYVVSRPDDYKNATSRFRRIMLYVDWALIGANTGAALAAARHQDWFTMLFSLAVALLLLWSRRRRTLRPTKEALRRAEQLREKYGVPVYTNYHKMVKDWPPSYKKDHVA